MDDMRVLETLFKLPTTARTCKGVSLMRQTLGRRRNKINGYGTEVGRGD